VKRRTFIKGAAGGAAILVVPMPLLQSCAVRDDATPVSKAFLTPPMSSRAHTWWHWMNGSVTRQGITLDMEAMKDAGLGGFHIFYDGEMPKGPVDFGSDEYWGLLEHAASEAERLGMEYVMHNCAGFSSSGGPWNTPDVSMQQLVWSETYADGGAAVSIRLPRPFARAGFYRDSCVIAFPSLAGEGRPMKDLLATVATNEGPVDKDLLDFTDLSTGVEVRPNADGSPGHLLLQFSEPFEARSVMLYAKRADNVGVEGVPGFGGPVNVLEISDDGSSFTRLCELGFSRGRLMAGLIDSPSVAEFEPARARFYRLSLPAAATVSDLRLTTSPRISKWVSKANFQNGSNDDSFNTGETSPAGISAVPTGMSVDSRSVVDLSDRMSDDGLLQWDAPPGSWTILRMGSTTTGVENHPIPDGAGGLECDKFSKEAIEHHFANYFGKLIPTLESMAARGMVVGALIDSYEVGMQNWTRDMLPEFEQRAGYSLVPYLPALTGRVVDNLDTSDRLLWDFRRTQADMIADYYYRHFTDICHDHGMISLAEPYSGGPFEEMQIASRVDVNMGEFWAGRGLAENDVSSLKTASSAAHLHGQSVVGAESFTGSPAYAKWQQYPFSLKAQGDWVFTLGINRYVFHRYAHQPHPDAAPGMTMGQWGIHFDRTNTWFPKATGWLDYVARCQHLLQQGQYVADLAYFNGLSVPVRTPSINELSPSPPPGLKYDVIDAETIIGKAGMDDGRMRLPGGASYRLLVFQQDHRAFPLELMKKISDLVNDGLCIYGPRPEGAPGMSGLRAEDEQVRDLARALWGSIDGITVTENSAGKGKVFWGASFDDVLGQLGIDDDFQYTSASGDAAISFIHEKADGFEYYFVSNRRRRRENIVATFRIEGKKPELWDALARTMIDAPVFDMRGGRTHVPITLESARSVFVVFREDAGTSPYRSVSKDNELIVSARPYAEPARGKYAGVKNDFALTLWLKPENDMSLPSTGSAPAFFGPGNSSYAVYPPAGSELYGAGHVACGLTAARNGLVVYERGSGRPVPMLVVEKPLAGWTHIALQYRDGAPSVYVDGVLAETGTASGNIVHPGLDEAYFADGASDYWGDMGKPELHRSVLAESEIRGLAALGAPPPEEPAAVELGGSGADGELLVWEDGRYAIEDSTGGVEEFHVTGAGVVSTISSPWRVIFPPDLGAPGEIRLPALMSLHRHADDGVKYFSGTATYLNTFQVAEELIAAGRKLYLDLGRVEILAEVRVNGTDLGIHWTQPYRVDITDVVHVGENSLEVRVTNLWPNRLIGDEQFPPENEYERGGTQFGASGGQIVRIPDWYSRGEPKPRGDRIAFTTYQHYFSDSPLLESGLVGPVRLRSVHVKRLGTN